MAPFVAKSRKRAFMCLCAGLGAMMGGIVTYGLVHRGSLDIAVQVSLEAELRQQRCVEAIRQYRSLHEGAYPASLVDVVAGGFLDNADVNYMRCDNVRVTISYIRPPTPARADWIVLYDDGPMRFAWEVVRGKVTVTATDVSGKARLYTADSFERAVRDIHEANHAVSSAASTMPNWP